MPLRLVGKHGRLVQGLIVVSARQNRPTDPGQFVGSRDDHHIACVLVSKPLIHFPKLEPSRLTRKTAARAPWMNILRR